MNNLKIRTSSEICKSSDLYYGICIEDVNHELYGGIWTQMIYGESFQEPPRIDMEDFESFGGNFYRNIEGTLIFESGHGDRKLLLNINGKVGEISADFHLEKNSMAGFLFDVNEVNPGMDRFIGYDVSIEADKISIGRHCNSNNRVVDIFHENLMEKWVNLRVKLNKSFIEIFVDNKLISKYSDVDPLPAGRAGIHIQRGGGLIKDLSFKDDRSVIIKSFGSEVPVVHGISGMWNGFIGKNAKGKFELFSENAFQREQSQRIISENGEVGIYNMGLNKKGIGCQSDKNYEGYFYAKTVKPVKVILQLESADGNAVYGRTELIVSSQNWEKQNFNIDSTGFDPRARFMIKLKDKGVLNLGYVFLQPGEWGRFKGLPFRKDVVEMLQKQGVRVIRMGGCMIHRLNRLILPEYPFLHPAFQ